MNVRRRIARVAVLAVALGAAACLDSIIKPLGPENLEEVENVPDNFRYFADKLDNVHDTRTYTWRNNGTTATVQHDNFVHHGSVIMIVRDALGKLVDSVPMEWQLVTETDAGTPGNWQVTLNFYGARGRVDVSLLRKEEILIPQ
jgi:hypothetical protein